MAHDKWRCDDCYTMVTSKTFLRAPSPFAVGREILGCPVCLEVGNFEALCDEPGCTNLVTCGTPTANGYRNTCSRHAPEVQL